MWRTTRRALAMLCAATLFDVCSSFLCSQHSCRSSAMPSAAARGCTRSATSRAIAPLSNPVRLLSLLARLSADSLTARRHVFQWHAASVQSAAVRRQPGCQTTSSGLSALFSSSFHTVCACKRRTRHFCGSSTATRRGSMAPTSAAWTTRSQTRISRRVLVGELVD